MVEPDSSGELGESGGVKYPEARSAPLGGKLEGNCCQDSLEVVPYKVQGASASRSSWTLRRGGAPFEEPVPFFVGNCERGAGVAALLEEEIDRRIEEVRVLPVGDRVREMGVQGASGLLHERLRFGVGLGIARYREQEIFE